MDPNHPGDMTQADHDREFDGDERPEEPEQLSPCPYCGGPCGESPCPAARDVAALRAEVCVLRSIARELVGVTHNARLDAERELRRNGLRGLEERE